MFWFPANCKFQSNIGDDITRLELSTIFHSMPKWFWLNLRWEEGGERNNKTKEAGRLEAEQSTWDDEKSKTLEIQKLGKFWHILSVLSLPGGQSTNVFIFSSQSDSSLLCSLPYKGPTMLRCPFLSRIPLDLARLCLDRRKHIWLGVSKVEEKCKQF